MNIFLILLLSLGLILLLKTKSRVKRVYIYNKINENDKHQDKKKSTIRIKPCLTTSLFLFFWKRSFISKLLLSLHS